MALLPNAAPTMAGPAPTRAAATRAALALALALVASQLVGAATAARPTYLRRSSCNATSSPHGHTRHHNHDDDGGGDDDATTGTGAATASPADADFVQLGACIPSAEDGLVYRIDLDADLGTSDAPTAAVMTVYNTTPPSTTSPSTTTSTTTSPSPTSSPADAFGPGEAEARAGNATGSSCEHRRGAVRSVALPLGVCTGPTAAGDANGYAVAEPHLMTRWDLPADGTNTAGARGAHQPPPAATATLAFFGGAAACAEAGAPPLQESTRTLGCHLRSVSATAPWPTTTAATAAIATATAAPTTGAASSLPYYRLAEAAAQVELSYCASSDCDPAGCVTVFAAPTDNCGTMRQAPPGWDLGGRLQVRATVDAGGGGGGGSGVPSERELLQLGVRAAIVLAAVCVGVALMLQARAWRRRRKYAALSSWQPALVGGLGTSLVTQGDAKGRYETVQGAAYNGRYGSYA